MRRQRDGDANRLEIEAVDEVFRTNTAATDPKVAVDGNEVELETAARERPGFGLGKVAAPRMRRLQRQRKVRRIDPEALGANDSVRRQRRAQERRLKISFF